MQPIQVINLVKVLVHIVIIVFLTIISQIGGIIYLLSILIYKQRKQRIVLFLGLYLVSTFLIVPVVAPYFGREKIKETKYIQAHSFFYKLLNRNYVKPKMNVVLQKISKEFHQKHKGIKIVCLDGNFPFIDKFPLLPHLSHNDGKKLDISLIYKDKKGKINNKKPSISGYGVFEHPKKSEYNQPEVCLKKGKWQYDFPKYLTFGTMNSDIEYSNKATRDLVRIIVQQKEVGKLFIEPHLKNRMSLQNSKIRFHGCQAVRHDDHIHFQLK